MVPSTGGTNYRPISLTSNISKIVEKLVHKCLYHFLDQNEILYNNQYSFRNNHSTIYALIDITEKIINALDNNNYACAVSIDLEKAFDTVNHTILLDKLKYYGVRRITNNWFKSFFEHRFQYTNINPIQAGGRGGVWDHMVPPYTLLLITFYWLIVGSWNLMTFPKNYLPSFWHKSFSNFWYTSSALPIQVSKDLIKERYTQGKNPKVTLYIAVHFDDIIHFLTLFDKFECILKVYVSK